MVCFRPLSIDLSLSLPLYLSLSFLSVSEAECSKLAEPYGGKLPIILLHPPVWLNISISKHVQ